MDNYNLTRLWRARKDSYATRQGDFILSGSVVLIGDVAETWHFCRALGGRLFRVIYVCQNGKVRDLIGRQGVYNSAQDGLVKGDGPAMASASRLNLSFWSHVGDGPKVNTGSGAGYRTLNASGILAIRCDGTDILTKQGQSALHQGEH